MCTGDLYLSLEELNWVSIPGANFIMKYKFLDEGYILIVSNLKEMFGENLDKKEITDRFCKSNPYAEMKAKVITKNLKQTLENILADKESSMKIDSFETSLRIQLQFIANQVSFIFNLEPTLLSSKFLQRFIIIPTLSHALLAHQENVSLKKRIKELETLNSSSSQKPVLDSKKCLIAFSLLNDVSVPENVILDSFLEMQTNIKECSLERSKFLDVHKKQVQQTSHHQSNCSSLSVKRELELLEPKSEIHYKDAEDESSIKHSNEAVSVLHNMKVKKKKNMKF